MGKEYPPLLEFLSEKLEYRLLSGKSALGYTLYYLDLSSWRLRLSDWTPVVHIQRSDLTNVSPRQLLQSLQDVVRERGWQRRIVLVLVDGDSSALRSALRSPLQTLAFVGEEEQREILRSRRPSGQLLDILSAQVPISILAPYNTTSPVTGSCFFDREYEVAKILGNPDVSYGRQRVFGSLGWIVVSYGVGLLVTRYSINAIFIFHALLLAGMCGMLSLQLPVEKRTGITVSYADGLRAMVRLPSYRALLVFMACFGAAAASSGNFVALNILRLGGAAGCVRCREDAPRAKRADRR